MRTHVDKEREEEREESMREAAIARDGKSGERKRPLSTFAASRLRIKDSSPLSLEIQENVC